MGSIFSVLCLTLIVMFVFAVLAYYAYGYGPDVDPDVAIYWGTIARAMNSLLNYIIEDGWMAPQIPLDNIGAPFSRVSDFFNKYFSLFFVYINFFKIDFYFCFCFCWSFYYYQFIYWYNYSKFR